MEEWFYVILPCQKAKSPTIDLGDKGQVSHPKLTEKPSRDIWLMVYLPLWKMMEFVRWDDDIPKI